MIDFIDEIIEKVVDFVGDLFGNATDVEDISDNTQDTAHHLLDFLSNSDIGMDEDNKQLLASNIADILESAKGDMDTSDILPEIVNYLADSDIVIDEDGKQMLISSLANALGASQEDVTQYMDIISNVGDGSFEDTTADMTEKIVIDESLATNDVDTPSFEGRLDCYAECKYITGSGSKKGTFGYNS